MTPFFQYAEDVLSEKIVTGRFIKLAVERFWRDYDKKDFEFDYQKGEKIVTFASYCNHWKGPKKQTPIIFEPHQHFYLIQKYGWINPNSGLPRFRSSVKMIARKQYKTTEAAVESLYQMKKGVDQPAQVFTCATKEDDAVVVVNDAGRIAMCSPEIKPYFKTSIHEPYVRRVICDNGSFMTYMTKGHDAVDISFGIGDECHDWPDASIKDRIESAMGNRLAPMFSTITTSGFNKHGYCFATLRDTSIKILEQTLQDDEQLILIFELDEGDDWKDESMWVKANPNVPYSLTHLPYLKTQFKKALNEGGSTEVNFKTKNLNMWVDAPITFIPTEIWDKNSHGGSIGDLHGQECYVGLEIGPSGEISAVAFLFPGEINRIKMLFFISEEALKINEFYRANAGLIKVDPGNEVEVEVAVGWVIEEFEKYSIRGFCFVNKMKSNSTIQKLVNAGYEGKAVAQHTSADMITATDEWEKLLRAGQVEHYNDPILRWMNSNCTAIKKEAGTRIEKHPKVYGIFACLNAIALWKDKIANGGTEIGILYL